MLKKVYNPLIEKHKKTDITFDQKNIKIPFSFKSKVPTNREIKKVIRKETAAEAIGKLYKKCAIFGITKGQFSLIELISAVLDQTGPAEIFISTWTAASADLTDAFELLEAGKITKARFLVDHTFQRRQPAYASKIRKLFGIESIRVTRNHAKFCLIRNKKWNIVIKTSMNLNFNPRLEDFDIQDDFSLAKYLESFMDEIFEKVKPKNFYSPAKININKFKSL